jgi:hypothetical protein
VVDEVAGRRLHVLSLAVVTIVRYGIPIALALAGLICLGVLDESARVEAWAMFTGAALASCF